MDAVEFFQTVNRLCKNRSCAGCPICKKGMIKDMCMVRRTVMLGDASVESIEEMISIVEQWAKDHPSECGSIPKTAGASLPNG